MLVSVKINEKEVDVIVNQVGNDEFTVTFNGKTFIVDYQLLSDASFNMLIEGKSNNAFYFGKSIYINGESFSAEAEDPLKKELLKSSGFKKKEGTLSASMPGNVVKILVNEGDKVKIGQGIIVLEAMKMENELEAPKDGIVKKIYVEEKKPVDGGTVLVEIE